MAAIPAGAGSLLGRRLGKYEVVALLALGGTAEIYLARISGTSGFEKYVVVKCLHDHLADDTEFVKMFLDEARLAAHLDHSNIVQTFELGEYENRYYMVMEFLAGLSLAMIVRRVGERMPNGRMPVPLALNIIAQACAGLHYAHDKAANGKPLHIVHRDISPQNLVVSFEGVVKIVDFGIAKADARETRTRSGTIKGKFAYMSPEQCVANNVDRRTDVFALGVIAHELLTGRRLFKRSSPYETYQAVIECAVEPPSAVNHELDPAIDPLVMRAIGKDKEQRYPNAEAFGDALQSYLHHRGKGSGPGDVGRFIDAAFAQEIDEHGQRMRELIAGRSMDSGKWDEEDDDKKPSRQSATVDLRGNNGGNAVGETSGLIDVGVPGQQASDSSPGAQRDELDDDDMPTTRPPDDDDDLPADRTRIESNPLERHAELAVPTPLTPLPLPTPPPVGVNAGAGASRPQMRFPAAAANVATMISDASPGAAPELAAPPPRASGQMPAPPIVPSNGRSSRPQPAANGPGGVPGRASPQAFAAQVEPGNPVPGNSQMPQGMHASGALIQPSAAYNLPGNPHGSPQGSPQHNLQGAIGTGAESVPALRPANIYDTVAHVDVAQIASPVGPAYPHADWAAVAALPVRVVPPWALALLFVAALGVALGVTFAIAQLLH